MDRGGADGALFQTNEPWLAMINWPGDIAVHPSPGKGEEVTTNEVRKASLGSSRVKDDAAQTKTDSSRGGCKRA